MAFVVLPNIALTQVTMSMGMMKPPRNVQERGSRHAGMSLTLLCSSYRVCNYQMYVL